MDKNVRGTLEERLAKVSSDLWHVMLQIKQELCPADLMAKNATEILSSCSYIIDQCCEMINPSEP